MQRQNDSTVELTAEYVSNTCNVQRRSWQTLSTAQQLAAITLFKSTQLLNCTRCQLTTTQTCLWRQKQMRLWSRCRGVYFKHTHFKQIRRASTPSELSQQSTAVHQTIELDSMRAVAHTVDFEFKVLKLNCCTRYRHTSYFTYCFCVFEDNTKVLPSVFDVCCIPAQCWHCDNYNTI